MWKKLMKNAFLDHVYLRCTQRECKPNEIIIEEYTKMFESRISAGATEQLPQWEKLHAKTVAWSYDMEGHAQKCVERYCELANKKVEQLYTVSSPCLDDHQVKQEDLESQVGSQIVKLIVFGTNWKTRHSVVCQQIGASSHKMDSGLRQTIGKIDSYIHRTNDFRQYCHVGNTAQHCPLGLFQDSDFWRPLGLESNLWRSLMYFRKPNICLHQLDVQETNVSIPQFHRIRNQNHVVGCWISNGW